jgi:hypothetical protein
MSALCITARRGFATLDYRQLVLRRAYRRLRTLGLDRYQARMLISDVLFAGHQEPKR